MSVDSQVTLGSASKGRSSRPGINFLLRKMASVLVAHDMRAFLRWVPTKRNYADGPSRGGPLGVMVEEDERIRLPAFVSSAAWQELPQAFQDLAG